MILICLRFDQRTCTMNSIRFGRGAVDGRNITNKKLSYRKNSCELDTSIGEWELIFDFIVCITPENSIFFVDFILVNHLGNQYIHKL